MRRELKKRGILRLKVVYSQEPSCTPLPPSGQEEASVQTSQKRQTPDSITFVPSVAGLIAAGAVVRDLLGEEILSGILAASPDISPDK